MQIPSIAGPPATLDTPVLSAPPGEGPERPVPLSLAVPERARVRIEISGVVQDVGLRPFVQELAADLGLAGAAGGAGQGVFVEVEGPPDAVARFGHRLLVETPSSARIEGFDLWTVPVTGSAGFRIVPGTRG